MFYRVILAVSEAAAAGEPQPERVSPPDGPDADDRRQEPPRPGAPGGLRKPTLHGAGHPGPGPGPHTPRPPRHLQQPQRVRRGQAGLGRRGEAAETDRRVKGTDR